jgi:phospholipid/cholesterol/gamma-HCH transport system permease protein
MYLNDGLGSRYRDRLASSGDIARDLLDVFRTRPISLFSLSKGMVMATVIVLVGCYYGSTASGGPVVVGTATAKSIVLNIVLVHLVGIMGTLVFWGANPRAPIGG